MKKFSYVLSVLLFLSLLGCNQSEAQNEQPTDETPTEQTNPTEEENNTDEPEVKENENTNSNSEEKEDEAAKEEEELEETEDEGSEIVFANGQITIPEEYYNVIEVVGDVPTIQNPDNLLVMANKDLYLPADYIPDDLVQPNVPFVFEGASQNYLRKEAADALEAMFAEAKERGLELVARSGFRSYETQAIVFQRNVDRLGFEEASKISAQPGTSEHQTGLTMDITAASVGLQLVEEFGETVEGIWLRENAHRFGFIMRYPEGKEEITKYSYEPWHFRYVGIEAAKLIYENDWTLEEFFGLVLEI